MDAETYRQFQQFQQFQEFQRFQELQRQGETGLAGHQEGRRAFRPPRWLRWLGKKLLAWLIAVIILIFVLNWLVESLFGVSMLGSSSDGEQERSVAESGGGSYHTNKMLPTNPYETVRTLYDQIAKGAKPSLACGLFDDRARRAFVTDIGYRDCGHAIRALQGEVDDPNAYAESVPSGPVTPVEQDTITIESCEYAISGGHALGVFTLREVHGGQWLIVGHENGPNQCPEPSTSPTTEKTGAGIP